LRGSPVVKTTITWSAVILGSLIGFVVLILLGTAWVGSGDRSPAWFLRWFTIAGTALAATAFMTGSSAGLRNRRSAGRIFFAVMPVAAYLLAVEDAGFLVQHADGGYWETPVPATGIALTFTFFAPFFLLFLATRRKNRVLYLIAVAAAVFAVIIFIRSPWTSVFLPSLAASSGLFAVFGLFWLGTDRLGWAPLRSHRSRSTGRRAAAIALACFAIFCADVAATIGLSLLRSSASSLGCGQKPLFAQPLSANHSVFTARVIFAGRSLELKRQLWREHQAPEWSVSPIGDWALARIQERFWGASWPRFVFLTNNVYWKDETYFVDGSREPGFLNRFLPIVEAGPCSRTKALVNADLELRAVKEGPSKSGIRIIGYVQSPDAISTNLTDRPRARERLAGAKILVKGASGTAVVTTDRSGVYELDGVPAGDYELKLDLPDTQNALVRNVDAKEIARLSTIEKNFYVFWNGTVEGTVRDDSGKPARTSLMLSSPSAIDQFRSFSPMTKTDTNGRFEFAKVPPGHYTLVVNPFGPDRESPYAPLYYPSAPWPQDAEAFELTKGQHLKNMDSTLQRLAEHKLPIQVRTPDGQAVKDPWLFIIYERTWPYYHDPLGGGGGYKTGNDGRLEISVFGDDLRLWIYAQVLASNSLVTSPMELRGSNLPDELDLTLKLSESEFTDAWRKITSANNVGAKH
jgi:hypothetical protein